MTKIRKFASVEQALSYILKELDGDEIQQATSKSVDYFRKCSDEDSREQINQKDAIELDIASARKGHGFPILNAHTALVENAVKSSDYFITLALIKMPKFNPLKTNNNIEITIKNDDTYIIFFLILIN